MKTKITRVKKDDGTNEIFLIYKDNKTTFSIAKLNQLNGHFEGCEFLTHVQNGFKEVEQFLTKEINRYD